ncbi:hypothetical protein AB0F42_24630 [Streptomyces buecherae]|uniref:MarR family transcriptional regulator n=1 Tax=Streptomyces buecherae TaxID=2763006 RepID=UPI0033E8D091
MSDTKTHNNSPAEATEPVHGLTGAPAAIYTELVAVPGDEGTTATELSLAAGVGRSTTGKALVTLEKRGLAVRTPGGHDGPRRTPDVWRAATVHTADSDEGHPPAEPAPSQPGPDATDSRELKPGDANENPSVSGPTCATEATSDTEAEPSVADEAAADAPQGGPLPADEHRDADVEETLSESHEGGEDSSDAALPTPQESGERPHVTGGGPTTTPGEKERLAPGALRQMVADYLQQHTGEAFTATKISREIDRSSGAITNALRKLVQQGTAEQVTDRPRTYRVATTNGGGA